MSTCCWPNYTPDLLVTVDYHPSALALPFGPTAAGLQLAGGGWFLLGWAVEETTGLNTARIVLRDGLDANGRYTMPLLLAAGESTRDDFSRMSITLQSGLFVDVTAGTVAGVVFILPFDVVEQEQRRAAAVPST